MVSCVDATLNRTFRVFRDIAFSRIPSRNSQLLEQGTRVIGEAGGFRALIPGRYYARLAGERFATWLEEALDQLSEIINRENQCLQCIPRMSPNRQTGSNLLHSCRRGQSTPLNDVYRFARPPSSIRNGLYLPYEKFRPAESGELTRSSPCDCQVNARPHRTYVKKSCYQI